VTGWVYCAVRAESLNAVQSNEFLHSRRHLHVAVARRTKRAKPGSLPKGSSIWDIGERWMYCISAVMSFLGAFAKLRIPTIRHVCPSGGPSVCMEQLGSHWTDFHKI
jgi:hypothetical protein